MSSPSVQAWVRKAESDLKVARDELATSEPATDAVCFHCQQCAEKYLKAYLICHQRETPRTHNIADLLRRCMDIDIRFRQLLATDVPLVTSYAVAVRYPGDELFSPVGDKKILKPSLSTWKPLRGFHRLSESAAGERSVRAKKDPFGRSEERSVRAEALTQYVEAPAGLS